MNKFKAGDHVRRKAEWKNVNWYLGDSVFTVVEADTYSDGKSTISIKGYGSFYADRFDLVTDVPTLPADSFPEIDVPKQVRTGEKQMGPLERALNESVPFIDGSGDVWVSLATHLKNLSLHGIGSFQCGDPECIRDYCKAASAYIDQAIAAEREEMSKASDSRLTDRERYAINQHDITCSHLAISNSPDDEGDTLFEAVSRLYHELQQLKPSFRGTAAEPHDYDLLKVQLNEANATIESYKRRLVLDQKYVDEAFQGSPENPAILPDFVVLGGDKYEAIPRLARGYLKQQAQLERLHDDLRSNSIQAKLQEIKQLKAENEHLREANTTTKDPHAERCYEIEYNAVPCNEIAWLLGWLSCDLTTEPLNDPPTDLCREKATVVNDWLNGVQS